MTRRAKRTDDNHALVVKSLRMILGRDGAVADLSGAGRGIPDILVGTTLPDGICRNFLFELKDPDKPPSRRRLTPAQERFHDAWPGQVAVVHTAAEAMEVIYQQPSLDRADVETEDGFIMPWPPTTRS